jgi:GNAT superfamily N-acetyltransferase
MINNDYWLGMIVRTRVREHRADAELRRSVMQAREWRRRPPDRATAATARDRSTAPPRPRFRDLILAGGRARAARPVRLPSGFDIVVRPVHRGDGPLLVEGFERLSRETRRLRFLGAKNTLTATEVRHLTEIDHHDHEALAALGPDGRGVGVARYVREPGNPHVAEAAIVVVDEWQRRGVGRQLISRLAQRAADEGIRCFTGIIADDNVAVVALLWSMGARVATTSTDAGGVRFIVPVASLLAEPVRSDDLVGASPCFA